MKDNQNKIRSLFAASGLEITPRQAEQFAAFYELLVAHNDDLDLTRLKSFADIVVKHFIDSIYFTEFIELPSPLLDIGTGAGFPGIPLKIFLPGLNIILSEPRKKRASFLELAVRELRLGGVEVYPHMITDKSFFTVNGTITRALESIDETLTRVSHFLPRGGRVIFMKGPGADDDLAGITELNRGEFAIETERRYTLPGTSYLRSVIVYRKESSATSRTYVILKDGTATVGSPITSAENKKFKELKKISLGDNIRKKGSALISGKKIINEIIARGTPASRELVLPDGYAENSDTMNAAIGEFAGRRSLVVLKKSLFNEIDVFNTGDPLLVAEIPDMEVWNGDIGPGCTLVVPFQDPVNVGSVIRSAVGFGVKNIIVLREAAHPFHPRSVRASAGSVFSANYLKGPSIRDLPEMMRDRLAEVVALDPGGPPLDSFLFPEKFILIPGLEGPGLPEALKKTSLSIPLAGEVESLNGPVAASIALYAWRRSYSPSN